ncbi:uncharacterized protein LOC142239312 [Haematobia irritans]|uniref:uncharacterized protein LOC142239312 n=1 Tax=Haematobia irritans TaxID=7368 RepID=UPI003F5045B7
MSTTTELPKCDNCNLPITGITFVKCHNCDRSFHFSPCSVLSENTYNFMSSNKKAEWKCQVCKPRGKSPNNVYHSFVYNEPNTQCHQQKQQRGDDDETNDLSKRFKQATTSQNTESNSNVLTHNNEQSISMSDLQNAMQQMGASLMQQMNTLNASNIEIKNTLSHAINTINQTLASLTEQVKELQEKDKIKSQQITNMETRIQKLEQQALCKNIEINNVPDSLTDPVNIIKKIAASVDLQLNDTDIVSALRLKRNKKIIVEFTSLYTKRELMKRLKGHKVNANIHNSNTTSYIYVNDELTGNNRRLLWMAKTKARECQWKFVWVRNGTIYARKAESSPQILINNAADIECICN